MKWIKKGTFSGKQYRDDVSRKISWGHWFAFFNIIVAILIGARYAFIIDWPDTLAGKLYFFVSLLGHFSFNVSIVLICIYPLLYGICWSIQKMVKCHAIGKFSLHQCQ